MRICHIIYKTNKEKIENNCSGEKESEIGNSSTDTDSQKKKLIYFFFFLLVVVIDWSYVHVDNQLSIIILCSEENKNSILLLTFNLLMSIIRQKCAKRNCAISFQRKHQSKNKDVLLWN